MIVRVNKNHADNTTTRPRNEQLLSSSALQGFPRVTLGDIEAAIVRYASSHFGYRKEFARQIHFCSTQTEGIYIYKLETFGEIRTKISTSTPYNGCAIDSDRNSPVPGLWDIPVHPHTAFKDSEKRVTIPHTEYVTLCDSCSGRGYIKCRKCSGSGALGGCDYSFLFSSPQGHVYFWLETADIKHLQVLEMFCEVCRNNAPLLLQGDRCYCCQRWGNGGLVISCDECGGKRELHCSVCRSHKLMKHCETLCVSWFTKVSEVADKETCVPFLKLSDAIGNTLICDEKEMIQPLIFDNEPSISSISSHLVREHSGAFPYIIKQRHSLRIVPIITVTYKWKGRKGEFYLYGIENKVYFKKYPAKWTSCTLI